jgi:hypothetical protein
MKLQPKNGSLKIRIHAWKGRWHRAAAIEGSLSLMIDFSLHRSKSAYIAHKRMSLAKRIDGRKGRSLPWQRGKTMMYIN